MTLRFKIALGVISVPLLTGAVLIVLMNAAIQRTEDGVRELSERNDAELRRRAIEWQSALERRGLQYVADWIESNLADQVPFAITHIKLPSAKLFASAYRLDVADLDKDGPLPPPTVARGPSAFRFTARDREKAIEARNLLDAHAAMAASPDPALITDEPAIAIDGNVYYWPHVTPGESSAQHVYRLELTDPLPATPGALSGFESLDDDLDRLVGSTIRTLALGTLLLLVALVVSVRLFITRPLEQLLAGSKRVALGDFSVPIPSVGDRDEIGRLVAAFNRMQEEVREYQHGMKEKIDRATQQIREQERSLLVAQRLAATGTLAAGLAHEINNPLGGMQNAVRRLRKEATDERHIAYLDLVDEGLRRIESLMGRILGFSRRREAEPRHYSVSEAIIPATSLVAFRFEGGEAKLEVDMPSDPPMLFGDPDGLAQVLTNLLINARDALKDGKGTVRLGVRVESDNVLIEVSDDGVGMDEATLARIYDPFFTTKEPGKGTGLGLSIAHAVVTGHGGSISARSKLGEGTSFTITLPNSTPPSRP